MKWSYPQQKHTAQLKQYISISYFQSLYKNFFGNTNLVDLTTSNPNNLYLDELFLLLAPAGGGGAWSGALSPWDINPTQATSNPYLTKLYIIKV